MAITALIVLLAAAAISGRSALGAHRVLIGNRSRLWRLILATAGLGYGLAPALRGNVPGVALVILGGAAVWSLVVETWRRHADESGRWLTRRRHNPTPERPEDEAATGGEPVTELDRADILRRRLHAYVSQLDAALVYEIPGSQAAIAGEIVAIATQLHDTLEVVLAERYQIRNTDRPSHA